MVSTASNPQVWNYPETKRDFRPCMYTQKWKAYKISKKKLCSKVLWSHNYSQIKLHSKVIFSDFVGFFFRGVQWWRSKFEQEHGQTYGRKWPKKFGWRRCGRYHVTCARRQEFEAARRSWIWLGVLGSLQSLRSPITKRFRLIMNIWNCSRHHSVQISTSIGLSPLFGKKSVRS